MTNANVRTVPPHLTAYTAAFKAWAEARGHYHLNETDDPGITLEMYQDGDHLKSSFSRAYTDSFISRVKHLLPAPFERPVNNFR